MRTFLGGLVLLWLTIVSAGVAAAQVTGRVEMIGLDGRYRPGCWTPMLVRLQSQGSPTGLYELRVYQHDLDGDTPYFTTRVTLTAGRGEQGFWTYFLPEPVHGGLSTNGATTTAELQQRLRITVNDATGRELIQLPVGNSTPETVDPIYSGLTGGRAARFVVFVNASGAQPALRDYEPSNIAGLQEDLNAVILTPDHLPESALGYDGVDAIVWLEGDPSTLAAGGSRRLDAIREYVSRGGHLVIGTPPAWQQLAGFGDLMPVTITDMERNGLASPTKELADDGRRFPLVDKAAPRQNPWDRFRGGVMIATATPLKGSVVDRWANRIAEPQKADDQTPWLVRKPVGFGCVSWVGQDLGSRDVTSRVNWGWPRVWETILGTASQPFVFPDPVKEKARFGAGALRDLGATVLDAMNLTGRAATLVGVTVLFFIAYWFIAGPGTYFLLRYRGRAMASWFAFGAVALGATAVTLGVVRVLLRGAPDVKHVSLVRVSADAGVPSRVVSRLGVYVPRDGAQAIALADTDARFASTITPFPIHPTLHQWREGDKYLFPAPIEYAINVPTGDDAAAPNVGVPFRTTMKRLRAEWFGTVAARIDGSASLRPSSNTNGYIAGVLTNSSGIDLRNVYVAFRHQTPGSLPTQWLMYVANWPKGTPLDLGASFNPSGDLTIAQVSMAFKDVNPNEKFPVRGQFKDWSTYFGSRLRAGAMGESSKQNDLADRVPTSVPLLSFFEQFPPIENDLDGSTYRTTRSDLHRNGLRDWDVGDALLAGQLVIVAEADGVPVPLPMTIAGDKVEGTGTTIYQFVLPLAPIPDAPATMPATTKATN